MTSTPRFADGLIAIKSPYPAVETMNRFESLARQRGLTVFARIDHAAGAASVGMQLRPTELLIFGHARGGTPLMLSAQTVGIDLPLKALVWEDDEGHVWLGYNDPAFLARRHGIPDGAVVTQLGDGLSSLAQAAVAP